MTDTPATRVDCQHTATPGPWAVNPLTAQVDAFNTGAPLPVCCLLWPTTERTEQETMANGYLIAAAPDQNAVCNELDRLALVIESAVRIADPKHHAAVLVLIGENKAALAKARGASQ